jgi:hypothetical protein
MAEFLVEYWWVLILGFVFVTGVTWSAPKRRRQPKGDDGGAAITPAAATSGDCAPSDAGGCDGGGGDQADEARLSPQMTLTLCALKSAE